MTTMTMGKALNAGLRKAMQDDDRVVLLGEDIGTLGGVFRITEPIAKGVAIGSAAHALGTAKASEIGEVEGAMSGLSIVVAGLLTVVGASVFANFL